MATVTEFAGGYEHLGEIQARKSHTQRRVFLVSGENAWSTRKTAVGIPQQGDVSPDDATLTVSQIEYRPHGAAQSDAAERWSHCLVIVDYSSLALETDGDVLVNIDHSVEVLTLPGEVVWTADSVPTGEPLSIIIPVDEINIYQTVSSNPRASINGYRGMINNATWRDYAAETVLFMGVSESVEADAVLGVRYRLNWKFLAKPVSQNKGPRTDSGAIVWSYVTPLPYTTVAFSLLGV